MPELYDAVDDAVHQLKDDHRRLANQLERKKKELEAVREELEGELAEKRRKVDRMRRTLVGLRDENQAWNRAIPAGSVEQLTNGAYYLEEYATHLREEVSEERVEESPDEDRIQALERHIGQAEGVAGMLREAGEIAKEIHS